MGCKQRNVLMLNGLAVKVGLLSTVARAFINNTDEFQMKREEIKFRLSFFLYKCTQLVWYTLWSKYWNVSIC